MILDSDQNFSVWRLLTGPNDDWPLALCDFNSVDIKNDVICSDRIHIDRIGESQLLHPSEQHRWYYVAGQQPNHLMVFRNTDSTGQRSRKYWIKMKTSAVGLKILRFLPLCLLQPGVSKLPETKLRDKIRRISITMNMPIFWGNDSNYAPSA